MRKTRCKVCGKKIQYTADRHYVVYHDNGAFGALAERTWYDAFDCAYCGSQIIVGERETGEQKPSVGEGEKKRNNLNLVLFAENPL